MEMSRVRILTRTKGFTFIELIVAVLLLSIAATFAAINWGTGARKKDASFFERFSGEVTALQEEAVSHFQVRAMQFDLTGNAIESGAVDGQGTFESFRKLDVPSELMLVDAVVNGNKTRGGSAQMKIYPEGFVDKVLLHFEGKREGWLTIIVWPLTGRCEVHDEYIDEIALNSGPDPS